MFIFVLFSKYSEEKKLPKLGVQTLPDKMYVHLYFSMVFSDLGLFPLYSTECSNLHNVSTSFSNKIKILFRMSFMLESFLCPFSEVNIWLLSRSGPSQSGVVLPALKQSLSSNIAERQRRTRALQRDRLKRTVQ